MLRSVIVLLAISIVARGMPDMPSSTSSSSTSQPSGTVTPSFTLAPLSNRFVNWQNTFTWYRVSSIQGGDVIADDKVTGQLIRRLLVDDAGPCIWRSSS